VAIGGGYQAKRKLKGAKRPTEKEGRMQGVGGRAARGELYLTISERIAFARIRGRGKEQGRLMGGVGGGALSLCGAEWH